MIYLIQAAQGGPVKIGYAADPAQRLRGLQTSHHEELRIIAQTEGGREEERALHRRLKQFRIKGEWFQPLDEVLNCLVRRDGERAVIEEARREIVDYAVSGGALSDLAGLISETESVIKRAAVGYSIDCLAAKKIDDWAEDRFAKRCLAQIRADGAAWEQEQERRRAAKRPGIAK